MEKLTHHSSPQTNKLKLPICYYGGKQNMTSEILSIIPNHYCYIEPFFGGGSVFFHKRQEKLSAINDVDSFVIDFYKVIKNNSCDFKKELGLVLYSQEQYRHYKKVWESQQEYSIVNKAVAFFVLTTQGFAGIIGSGWGTQKVNRSSNRINSSTIIKSFYRKKDQMIDRWIDWFILRIRNTMIYNEDALYVIKKMDDKNNLFYIDPPYFNSVCKYSQDYTESMFSSLLTTLSSLNGKFILSSYPSATLDKFIKDNGWKQKQIKSKVSVHNKPTYDKLKTECLTCNFDLEKNTLF